MNFLKNNFLYVIIFVLVAVVLLQRCGGKPIVDSKPKIEIKIDTVYHDTTIYAKAKPKPPIVIIDTFWRKDTSNTPLVDTSQNCSSLYKKYVELGDKYYSKNIYTTEFKHAYGKVKIIDTISQNNLLGSQMIADLSIPEVTKTITITNPYVPTRQLYIGGGLYGNTVNPVSMAHVGLLYKDKKDKIYQLSVGYNGQIQYGISTYWKLRLK
jgi:hypothetical protein